MRELVSICGEGGAVSAVVLRCWQAFYEVKRGQQGRCCLSREAAAAAALRFFRDYLAWVGVSPLGSAPDLPTYLGLPTIYQPWPLYVTRPPGPIRRPRLRSAPH